MKYYVRMLMSEDDNYTPDFISNQGSTYANCGESPYESKEEANKLRNYLQDRGNGRTYIVFEES